jgi:magnesium transporter
VHVWYWAGWSDPAEIQGHQAQLALAVLVAVAGVVLWGTVVGSMLPIILRRLKFDPATVSAPFVATLIDVTGVVIYFSTAMLLLRHTLLAE